MRLLRACTYALGALAAVLVSLWGVPSEIWTPFEIVRFAGSMTMLVGTIVLLAAGRAPALLLVPFVCVPLAVINVAAIGRAEADLARGFVVFYQPQFVLPAAVLAIVSTLLSLPYCVRLLRRSVG
jgi:hypothetical protein